MIAYNNEVAQGRCVVLKLIIHRRTSSTPLTLVHLLLPPSNLLASALAFSLVLKWDTCFTLSSLNFSTSIFNIGKCKTSKYLNINNNLLHSYYTIFFNRVVKPIYFLNNNNNLNNPTCLHFWCWYKYKLIEFGHKFPFLCVYCNTNSIKVYIWIFIYIFPLFSF